MLTDNVLKFQLNFKIQNDLLVKLKVVINPVINSFGAIIVSSNGYGLHCIC